MVTTYDAGMAVPDWPSTYGYNLFLYPISTWIAGPFDLFIEHGHRLLGSVVGLITIGLVVAAWRSDSRGWFRWLTLAALALVIAQGLLGGARVVLNSRTIAMIHGCVGPAFFALSASMAVMTSRWWRNGESVESPSEWKNADSVKRLALLVGGMSYLQILLGAQVRHIPATAPYDTFRIAVIFHVVIGFLLLGHILLLAWKVRGCPLAKVRQPAQILLLLALLQIGLGLTTWVMKYGFPFGLGETYSFAANWRLIAQGYWPAMITTAHVAIGSLILATSLVLCVRSLRGFRMGAVAAGSFPVLVGVAS